MSRLLTHILLLLLIPLSLSARDIVVVGQVLTADSVPLPSAEVWFQGTNIGGITNGEGFFYLRSIQPQRSLVVSVVGYRRKTVRLDYGHDQMLTVILDEDYWPLDEMVVRPDNSQALSILRRVYAHRRDSMLRRALLTSSDVNLTDIPNHTLQRRLFDNIRSGIIDRNDSSYSLPAYHSLRDSTHYLEENFLPVFDRDQWRDLLSGYSPHVNLYNPYVTILGYNFLSPISRSPGVYYDVYLLDSFATSSSKTYRLKFRPKSTNGLYLQGTIDVDSSSWRIVASDVKTSPYTNINILNSFTFSHNDTLSSQALSLGINPLKIKNMNLLGAMLFEHSQLDTSSVVRSSILTVSAEQTSHIDSIKGSHLVRTVHYVFDLLLTQHVHAGPIDIGPVFSLFHYNKRDGATPILSLRTNELCLRNVSFGGYFGYAHTARQMLYGGNIKFRTRNLRNQFTLAYDHKSYKYGFDDSHIFDENNINDADNLLNSISQIRLPATNDFRTTISTSYTFERRLRHTDFRFYTRLYYQRVECDLSQLQTPQAGASVLDNIALQADVRLAWQQRSYNTFFQRYYFNSRFPVVHLYGEFGFRDISVDQSHLPAYGKLGVYAEQKTPLGFGHLTWSARTSGVIGAVPFYLLDYIRTSRGSLNMVNDFTLLNQMEFASDLLLTATLRYQTHGYLFGYIPGIKRLGIREDLYLNIGYGWLSSAHSEVMPLYGTTQPWGNAPYVECGFGLSNLFSFFKLQFMFRCTYRHNPDAQLFSVKWAAEL